MLTDKQRSIVLNEMLEKLELPESAYIKAKERYDSLGLWFDKSECKKYNPHIFPQGSFRLGTAIRPLDDKAEYDLDLSCKLRVGVSKESHTQKELKQIIGREVSAYRSVNGIKAPVEEKHRCWRLEYADELSFHIDIVPCIPAAAVRQRFLFESMRKAGETDTLATNVSQLAVSITDYRHAGYASICDDWHGSNPEGYALWFEDRMSQLRSVLEARAQIDPVPSFKLKSPLQRVVQLLKRHRDQMFKGHEEMKPISIIITTLAARAYKGEADIGIALHNILNSMDRYIAAHAPRVPNPVNPEEDFADRWNMPEGKKANLEGNFMRWLVQARTDIDLLNTANSNFLKDHIEKRFMLTLNAAELSKKIGIVDEEKQEVTPQFHVIAHQPPKPWRQ